MFIFLIIYLIPSFIAVMNTKCVNRVGAIIVNLLLGVTIIGWIIALVMACNTGKSTK